MKHASQRSSRKMSAQTSSLLLGVALATLLSQSALLCQTGSMSGFGWALVASLASCLYTVVSQWSELVQTLVPESSTWKRAIVSGFLLAAGLFTLGHSLSAQDWSPIHAIGFAFIPWSRALWRRLFVGDTLNSATERAGAFVILTAACLFLLPEAREVGLLLSSARSEGNLHHFMTLGLSEIPRSTAFLSALLFGASSSLQKPIERSIPSQTYWTIPTAVAAIVLSTSGWVALHLSGSRAAVMGPLEQLPIHRVFACSPAIFFGIVLLALRPQLHIRNSLRIGREMTHWWQGLGLLVGILISFLLISKSLLTETDAATLVIVIMGQFIALRHGRQGVRFAQTLASVPSLETSEPLITLKQN